MDTQYALTPEDEEILREHASRVKAIRTQLELDIRTAREKLRECGYDDRRAVWDMFVDAIGDAH